MWSLRSIIYDGYGFKDILNDDYGTYGIGVAGSDGVDAFLAMAPSQADPEYRYVVEDFIEKFRLSGLKAFDRLGSIPLIQFNSDVIPLFTFDSNAAGIDSEYASYWVNNGGDDLPGVVTDFTDYTSL